MSDCLSQHEISRCLKKSSSLVSAPQDRRAALEELLASAHSYDSELSQTTVRPYVRELVSLPEVGDNHPQLLDVLDTHGQTYLKDFRHQMLHTPEEWAQISQQPSDIRSYMDVRLSADPKLYHQLIRDLFHRHMLRFTNDPYEIVTPFFVI